MCGILGAWVNKPSITLMKNLFDLFNHQKSRGIDGAGISINGKKIYRFRSFCPYRIFASYNYALWGSLRVGSRVIIHHRYPTSTANKPKCNHPIASEDGKIHIIHNGIISNWYDLEKSQRKAGHTFETEDKGRITDSEVLVHALEDGFNSDMVKAIEYMDNKAQGSYAVAIQKEGDDNIYLLKRSNPIIISKDSEGNLYFSSEFKEMGDLVKVVELKHGEIGKLTKDGYVVLREGKEETWEWNKKSNIYDGYGSYYYNRNRYIPNFYPYDNDKGEEEDRIDIGKKAKKLIKKTTVKASKKTIKYSSICDKVFKVVQSAFPKWDVSYHPIRIAIREEIDDVLYSQKGIEYIG